MVREEVKVAEGRGYGLGDGMGRLVIQDIAGGGGNYGKWLSSTTPTLFRRS